MKADNITMLLYLVIDKNCLWDKTLEGALYDAIAGGVTFVQFRDKDLSYREFVTAAASIKRITDCHGIPFVINDRIDAALEIGADGAHIGQHDMEAASARQLLGRKRILGVSVQSAKQAVMAERSGADYLGAGSIFPSPTKLDAERVSLETLKEITSSVSIPVVAIGGIKEENIMMLKGTGISGVAVVSAILAKRDIRKAAERMLLFSKLISGEMIKNESRDI